MLFIHTKNIITTFAKHWLDFLKTKDNALNVIFSLLILKAAYIVSSLSGYYATENASAEVTDIVFSHIPRIDTSFIHGNISFFLFDLRIPLFILFIRYVPFGAKALAAIVLTRAITINLTHLGIPADQVPILSNATYGGDLFFSGHVANLYMLSLIFWNIKWLRYFFMAVSVLFGFSAVLGHYHYTIDVVAAPFFTYGIYVLCKKAFKKDYELTEK